MDYSWVLVMVKLLIVPVILITIASLYFWIYELLTSSYKKSSNQTSPLNSLILRRDRFFFEGGFKNVYNYVLVLYLIYGFFLAFLIAGIFRIIDFVVNLELILLLGFLLLPYLLFSGLPYKGQDLITFKNLIKEIANYAIPLILSMLSVFMILQAKEGMDLIDLKMTDLIHYQINSSIKPFSIKLPALILFINPFAAIGYCFSTLGIFRGYHSNFFEQNELNKKLPSKLLRNIIFLIFASLFIMIFLGGGLLFYENLYLNLLIVASLVLLFVVCLSLLDRDRPHIFIEKKLFNRINIPLLFSIIALIYSVIIIYAS